MLLAEPRVAHFAGLRMSGGGGGCFSHCEKESSAGTARLLRRFACALGKHFPEMIDKNMLCYYICVLNLEIVSISASATIFFL